MSSSNGVVKTARGRKNEIEPKWKGGELDVKYQCPSCNDYLRFPVQFEECGHYVCSSCLADIMRVAPRCPTCQTPISKDKIVNDKALQTEIQSLEIFCNQKEKGCEWEGTLKDTPVHNETCLFVSIDCPNGCGAKFDKRFTEKHGKADCPKRTVNCEFCSMEVIFEEEIPHLNVCSQFRVPCPNQCSTQDFPRHQLQDHLDNHCTKQALPCPFNDCGCEYRGDRTSVAQHIKDAPGIHLNLAGRTITIQKKLLEMYEERNNEQKQWIEVIARKINGLEKSYGPQFIWRIDQYQERLQEARSNKKTTLFSPQFLTSRHGYRLALSICLCGDGKAKGKFVSLFICICRGEYDPLLVWPFCHRVTFTMLDQCEDVDNRRHITYSVKPNICKENKPFLGRPISERNASFGAQKFTDLEALMTLEYIKDDTMFIKVEIDNDEMIPI